MLPWFHEMLFYKWIFNLQIHHNWRLAFTLPQLQFLLPRFYSFTLTIDCSASKHNRHWKQQMQRDKQHASTTPSTVRVHSIEIVIYLPQPASTTLHWQRHSDHQTQFMLPQFWLPLVKYCSSIDFSTTKHNSSATASHSSCCHDFGNCHWLLIFQHIPETALKTIVITRDTHHALTTTPQFVLNFPLPLCSIFDTAIDNQRYCFLCISYLHFTAIELLQLPLVDNYTSLHNSPEYFPRHHQLTESTSCSIVPSPTSKHMASLLTTHHSFRVAFPPVVINQPPGCSTFKLVQPANTTTTIIYYSLFISCCNSHYH